MRSVAGSRGPRRMRWWREAVLLLGFLLIVVAGVFSVLLPELADEPGESAGSDADTAGRTE